MPVKCENPFVARGTVAIPPLDLTKAHQYMDNQTNGALYKVVPNKLKDPDFSEMTVTLESSHSTIHASEHCEQKTASVPNSLQPNIESELTNISKIMAVDEILMSRDESGDINLC